MITLFNLQDYECPFEEVRWTYCLTVFPCVNQTLKVVEVNGFEGNQNAFVLLGYLISFGVVMEKLDIKVPNEVGLVKAQRLLNYNKASPSLQISISQV